MHWPGRCIEISATAKSNALHKHETALKKLAEERLKAIPVVRLIGTASHKAAVIAFTVEDIHNQDIGFLLNQQGIAVRTGHHCAMPLMEHLNVEGTVRASFAPYNTLEEVNIFADCLEQIIAQHDIGENVQSIVKTENIIPALFNQFSVDQHHIDTTLQTLFSCKDWQSRYRQLMLLGKNMTALQAEYRTEETRLHGCESQVWLHHYYDDNSMQLHFAADSDAVLFVG